MRCKHKNITIEGHNCIANCLDCGKTANIEVGVATKDKIKFNKR